MILINNLIEDAIRKLRRLQLYNCLDIRTHKNHSEKLKEEIYNNILQMINERAYKIKDVTK